MNRWISFPVFLKHHLWGFAKPLVTQYCHCPFCLLMILPHEMVFIKSGFLTYLSIFSISHCFWSGVDTPVPISPFLFIASANISCLHFFQGRVRCNQSSFKAKLSDLSLWKALALLSRLMEGLCGWSAHSSASLFPAPKGVRYLTV